ncbi:unnamed protein product [Rhizoctonia solani]|uniref:Uncharacterized protein n=1 Tax=Rhizoctonia solani TaxID=456999 RepID=A0A8H3HCT5_9AGAM|nr:unnamed protein product [Rhizoctonia solani]
MIKDDKGDRPQLVHEQWIHPAPRPFSLSRLLMGLRVKSRPPKVPEVVDHRNQQATADTLGFVTRNYRSGDQVILLADCYVYGDHAIKWMEILARHLYDRTTPSKPFEGQPEGGTTAPGQQIPIHAVVALGGCTLPLLIVSIFNLFNSSGWDRSFENISLMSDGLKSTIPPMIEHIICFGRPFSRERSCSTMFDSDGSIISREMTMHDQLTKTYEAAIHATKQVIYYKPEEIPDWDNLEPVWRKVLNSSPSGIPRKFPSSTLPAGIYQQELRRYQGQSKESDRLHVRV